MSESAGDLVFLIECSGVELATVQGLLEGNGIRHVCQGANHASLLGGATQTLIVPRVLVARGDLERARALLASRPQAQALEGSELEGAVCPVHELAARATCDRCGTYLCQSCTTLGNPPLCESCVAHESAGLKPLSENQRFLRRQFTLLVPVAILILLFIGFSVLRSLLR